MTTRSLFILVSFFFPALVYSDLPKISDDPTFSAAPAYANQAQGAPAAPETPGKNEYQKVTCACNYPWRASAFQDDWRTPAPWSITSVP